MGSTGFALAKTDHEQPFLNAVGHDHTVQVSFIG